MDYSWNWFWWFILGLVAGVSLNTLWFAIRDKVTLKWYEWGIGGTILFLFIFMVQTFFASFAEWAPRAAWMSLLFMGLPIAVLFVILWRLVKPRIQ